VFDDEAEWRGEVIPERQQEDSFNSFNENDEEQDNEEEDLQYLEGPLC